MSDQDKEPQYLIQLSPQWALSKSGDDIKIASFRGRALLSFLALGASALGSREQLAALLWSGTASGDGRTNLRQLLSGLNKTLDSDGFLRASNSAVWLDRSMLKTHHELALTALEADFFEPWVAQQLNIGDNALSEFERLGAEFQDWVLNTRQNLKERVQRALKAKYLLDTTDVGLRLELAKFSASVSYTHLTLPTKRIV